MQVRSVRKAALFLRGSAVLPEGSAREGGLLLWIARVQQGATADQAQNRRTASHARSALHARAAQWMLLPARVNLDISGA